MRVEIEPQRCTLSAICVELCPPVFELGVESARVKVKTVPKAAEDCVRRAVKACPTKAIRIIEK